MTPEPLPVDHPLTRLDNCVLVPHLGSATIQTRGNMASMTLDNILAGYQTLWEPALQLLSQDAIKGQVQKHFFYFFRRQSTLDR